MTELSNNYYSIFSMHFIKALPLVPDSNQWVIQKEQQSHNKHDQWLQWASTFHVIFECFYVVMLKWCPLKYKITLTLTRVAQLVDHRSVKPKVAGLIPSQGTCLGCGFNPWSGHMREAIDRCFSSTLAPSLPLCLKVK